MLGKMQVRIYYGDTDCGGIAYHTKYIEFCERARSELFFSKNQNPVRENIGFVVKNIQAEFLSPARLGDLLDINTEILELRGASLLLNQEIFLQDKKLFFAKITLVAFDFSREKIVKTPKWATEIFTNTKV